MLCSVLVNIDQQKKVSENILLSNFNLTEKKNSKKVLNRTTMVSGGGGWVPGP